MRQKKIQSYSAIEKYRENTSEVAYTEMEGEPLSQHDCEQSVCEPCNLKQKDPADCLPTSFTTSDRKKKSPINCETSY